MIDAPIPATSPPPRRGLKGRLKKRAVAAGLALALIVTGAVLLVSSLSLALPSAREDIEARLSRLTGSPVHVDGNASFSLFPRARITLTDVRIGESDRIDAAALDIDRVEADFDLLRAMLGGAEIERVTLIRPEIVRVGDALAPLVEPDAGSPPPPIPAPVAVDARAASGLTRTFLARFEGLRELRIRDGLFRLPDGRGISNANLAFAWAGGTTPAKLSGTYVWNGQPTELDARIETPLLFFAGTQSPVHLGLTSPSIEAAFVGQGAAGESLQLGGALRVSAPSLSRALRWLGDTQVNLPDFGSFTIETQIQMLQDRITLGSAKLDFGGNSARGALEAITGSGQRRPSVSGTLAFDQMDFAMLTQAIAPAPRTLLDLQRPLRTDLVRGLDLDLRLSASEATLGRANAANVAATVKLAGGVGTIDIGDMSIFGGRGEMRVALDARLARPAVTVSGSLRGVRAGDFSSLVDGTLPLATGLADADLTLRAPATNWGEILAGNRGELTLRVSDGTLRGLDSSLLARVGAHPVNMAASGTAQPFDRLLLEARTLGTKLRLDTLSIAMAGGEAKGSGVYDVRTADLELGGQFHRSTAEASGTDDSFTTSQPIGFTLKGQWPEPVMTVGPQAKPI
ncbi:AsmA-like C-terminal region-containing protein [Aureimonas sp. AU12]|uniref:AsmA family protein n=1 Tax=Aureimonas sp. AU12 TaxID=1638161 RepID=UPI00078575E3|nr:AsmA-like C-terminal region-containing protein [Aureimonas sp. AU12]